MKQAWNRLGSRDAISWVAALLGSIQLAAGSLAPPFVDVTARLCETVKRGLGSQIFDEMCLDWSRTQYDSIVRLDARIPLTV